MNDQRKLISWSPHAAKGPASPHAHEFLVCSSSLRLFRATTQLGSSATQATTAQQQQQHHSSYPYAHPSSQPLSRQLSSDHSDARTSNQWGVTVRAHSQYEAQEVLPRSSFDLLDTFTYPGQVFRCIGWSHHASQPYMIGGGQASGKLVVLNFDVPGAGGGSMTVAGGEGGRSDSSASRIVKEFQPRYARACHVVCWNPLQSNQVAVGLDRVRNGCGTLIWDVTQQGSTGGSGAGGAVSVTPAPTAAHHYSAFVQQGSAGGNNILNINSLGSRGSSSTSGSGGGVVGGGSSGSAPIETVTEPLGRVSNSEATLSLNWLPGDPFSLAVGTGFKWLRIYDIRGNSRPTSVVAHAKSVNGVSFDPFNAHRLATFTDEGTAKIWDMRMLTRREIFQIHTGASATTAGGSSGGGSGSGKAPAPKQLVEVEWCPTAAHRIATIHRDDDGFRLWDLSGCAPAMVAATALPCSPGGSGGSGAFSDGDGHGGDSFDMAHKLASVPSALDVIGAAPTAATGAASEQVESAPFRHVKLACLTNAFQFGGGGGGGGAGGAGQGASGSGGSVSGGGSGSASLSSLSWHPLHRQRLLLITSHGLVEDKSVRDNVPLHFSPADSAPAFAVDRHLFVGGRAAESAQHGQGKDAPLALLAASTAPSSPRTAAVSPSLFPTPSPAFGGAAAVSAAGFGSFSPSAPDPMLFLSQDISARMKVRALLGYGLDPATNERVARKVAQTLRSSVGTGAGGPSPLHASSSSAMQLHSRSSAREIERSLLEEGVADEQTLVRVWDWMVQSERLHSMQKHQHQQQHQQQFHAHSPSHAGQQQQPPLQQGRGRFTGILSLLLPSLTSDSLASLEAAASGAQNTPVPTLTTPTGATTLLSLLKNEGSGSSATSTPIASPSHAANASSAALALSPPSIAVGSSAAQGFLPSGFQVYVSPQRSEALKLCGGWFDIFKLDPSAFGSSGGGGGGGGGTGPQLQHAATRPVPLSSDPRRFSPDAPPPPLHPSSFPSVQHYMYELHIQSLETQGRYEKAAMVCIFHLDLERALHSLTLGAQRKQQQQQQQAQAHMAQGQQSFAVAGAHAVAAGEEGTRDLGLVAMALSGYANFAFHSGGGGGDQRDDSSSSPPPALHQLWNQTWAAALSSGGSGAGNSGAVLSPSLKAIFSFLSTFAPRSPTAAIYSALLDDSSTGGGGGLDLQDKLGFMLRFLPDGELLAFLLRLTRHLVGRGDLDAIVLTGLNHAQVVAQQMTPTSPLPAASPSASGANAAAGAVSVVTSAPPSGAACVSFTMELLQSYVDRTGDIQTAAILGCFAGVSINFAAIAAATNQAGPGGAGSALNSPSAVTGSSASSPSAGGGGSHAVASPFGDSNDPSVALSHFIYFYKQLLNQWQLWGERARFDVARALLEKSWTEEEQARLAAVAQQQYGPGSGSNRGGSSASAAALQLRKPSHHTQVRPHISARCNFCGQSLSLEAMSGGAAAGAGGAGGPGHPSAGGGAGGRTAAFRPRGRVGAARGVPDQNSARIRGCPNCRKALPRCALCLVSFDCDTPHLPGLGAPPSRLRKRLQQSSDRGAGGGGGVDDDSGSASAAPSSSHLQDDDVRFDQSSMHDFSKWFTWCQGCRHGGHADHMADWFGQHGECPVTDCRCRCMSLDLLPSDGSGGSGGGPKVQPMDEQGESAMEAQLRANEALAAQQAYFLEQQQAAFTAQYHQQQQQQQQHGLLLSQQLSIGLPAVDAVTLAQAIRLIQMSRTPSVATPGQTIPAGLDLTTGLAQLHFSPSASPPPPPSSSSSQHSQQATPAGTNPTTTPIHHAASSPYLHAAAAGGDVMSTPSYAPQQQHQQQQTTPQHAPQSNPVLPRPGSQITLTGRSVTAGPSPARGNFPLTRW